MLAVISLVFGPAHTYYFYIVARAVHTTYLGLTVTPRDPEASEFHGSVFQYTLLVNVLCDSSLFSRPG